MHVMDRLTDAQRRVEEALAQCQADQAPINAAFIAGEIDYDEYMARSGRMSQQLRDQLALIKL